MLPDTYNPDDYYTADDFQAYLRATRQSNATFNPTGDGVIPSFTNISSVADQGAFDVRSDDIAEESEILALSDQKKVELENELSIRQGAINTVSSVDELNQKLTTAQFDYEKAITAGSAAIREQAGLPNIESMMRTVMKSDPINYKSNNIYKGLYGQRTAVIANIMKKEKDLVSGHIDSRLHIKQLEDAIAAKKPKEIDAREARRATNKLEREIRVMAGFSPEEEAIYTNILGRSVTAADIKELEEEKPGVKWLLNETVAGNTYNGAEVLQFHPSAYDAWKTLTEFDATVEKTALVRSTADWEASAKKAERQAIATFKTPPGVTGVKEIEARKQRAVVDARIRDVDASMTEFKKKNTDMNFLDLATDPTVTDPKEVAASKFILAYMNKYIDEGETLYDINGFDLWRFQIEVKRAAGFKPELFHVDLNEVARKMFRNLKKTFNDKYTDTTGVILTVDDFAMWGVLP